MVAIAISTILPIAVASDVTILLEPVNTRVDHPGVLFNLAQDAAAVIGQVSSPRVKMLYDAYHSTTEGEEPWQIVPQIIGMIEYVQIADSPGRGEPGTGCIDWPGFLKLLEESGYCGPIGIECHPSLQSTSEALSFFRDLCSSR